MSKFEFIRHQASGLRRDVCGSDADQLIHASEVINAVREHTSIKCLPLDADDPILAGALAVFDEGRIYYSNAVSPKFANYCIAHEFGHHILHSGATHCTETEINFEVSDDGDFSQETYVVGYSQSEKTEREANLFACELLIPHRAAKKAFFIGKLSAGEIAEQVGVSLDLVYSQLAYAMIAGEEKRHEGSTPSADKPIFTADETQLAAAQTGHGTVLLEAAPGTGKTRTLIDRICFLLSERAVEPEKILALTFTNKAAEEMRERIGAAVGIDTASRIYMATFHAFGLDLLRRYHETAGLQKDAPLIDSITALEFLEKEIAGLKLKHHLDLREPAKPLSEVLQVISTAKDEMVSPERFAELAELQLKQAESDDDVVKAEKCVEAARIYSAYQNILQEKGMVDYGDLLFRSLELLKGSNRILAEIQARYDHILVDEYQDVNRVSAELLKLISKNGEGVWAVGDARQAIYRWRGAAPTRNISGFHQDFPDARRMHLGKNYRSRPEVVSAVSKFASFLDGVDETAGFSDWDAHRDEVAGEIRFDVVRDLGEEALMIAERMKEQFAAGVPWHEQALIARTHTTLERFAERLDKCGIPVMYLGNWLESYVTRDLLSWLSLVAGDKYGLVRVGKMKEFGLDYGAIKDIIAKAIDDKTTIAETINAGDKESPRSPGEIKIAQLLSNIPEKTGVAKVLSLFLFDHSNYLRSNDLTKIQKIGIFQLLQLARSFDNKRGDDELLTAEVCKRFLNFVRRVKQFGDKQNLGQIPESAFDDDAVRLVTIHAAKGLEFETVFIPQINASVYPNKNKGRPKALPNGIGDIGNDVEHKKEEKCLFFVAISRAKQTLFLSRIAVTGRGRSHPSEFLTALDPILPIPANSDITWESGVDAEKSEIIPDAEATANEAYFYGSLRSYAKCPRRFFYRDTLKKEDEPGGIYTEFYDNVRFAKDWYLDEFRAGKRPNIGEIKEKFLEGWQFADHAYYDLYVREAENFFTHMAERGLTSDDRAYQKKRLTFELPNGQVKVTPDLYSESGSGETRLISAENWSLRHTSEETLKKDEELQLMLDAARQMSDNVDIKYISLKTGDAAAVEPRMTRKEETPVKTKFSTTIKSIDGLRRQDFSPKTGEDCPRCRFYFICSADRL